MQRSGKAPTITCDVESQWLKDLKDCAPRSVRGGVSTTGRTGNPPAKSARVSRRGHVTLGDKPQNPNERRHFARFKTLLSGMISDQAMQSDCRILDLSLGGARIGGLDGDQRLPERFSVRIDRFGLTEGRLLWQSGDQAGVRFDGEPTAIAALFGAFVPKHCRQALAPRPAA